MEYDILKPTDAGYPRRLLERMKDEAPPLYFNGPLKLLDRFNMAVICADMIPGQAFIASNKMLFKIRDYSMNYVGPWHSVQEGEIFRLALDVKTDPEHRRSLTILTARGLACENFDNFLGDRFGYKGPFIGFPQKEEFYRRANEKEILWLSVTDPPDHNPLVYGNIMFRNLVACALADVIFVPFAEKGTKTLVTVRRALKLGIPIFTCQYGEDKETDVNKDLFKLGIEPYAFKTVGAYLESFGASLDAPSPFPPKDDAVFVEAREQEPGSIKVRGKKRSLKQEEFF